MGDKITSPLVDQSMRLAADHVASVISHQGRQSIYHFSTDISDIVEARNAAQHNVQQLLLLQEMASVSYWSVELVMNTIHWSREVYRIHAIDQALPEPSLEDAIKLYHPDDIKDVEDA